MECGGDYGQPAEFGEHGAGGTHAQAGPRWTGWSRGCPGLDLPVLPHELAALLPDDVRRRLDATEDL